MLSQVSTRVRQRPSCPCGHVGSATRPCPFCLWLSGLPLCSEVQPQGLKHQSVQLRAMHIGVLLGKWPAPCQKAASVILAHVCLCTMLAAAPSFPELRAGANMAHGQAALQRHVVVLPSSPKPTPCPAGARIERDFCMIMAVAGDTLLALHHHLHGQRLVRPGALDLLWTVSCCSKCLTCSQC